MVFLLNYSELNITQKVQEIPQSSKKAVQSYVSGLIIEMIVVSVLTSIDSYIIGVEYFYTIRANYRDLKPYSIHRNTDCRNIDHSWLHTGTLIIT
jgi:hypothetical protein